MNSQMNSQMNPSSTNILDFDAALTEVLAHAAHVRPEQTESKALLDCLSRTLAETVAADRDQPPFDRSTRDGFAIRSADPAADPIPDLTVVGQIRAGQQWSGKPLAHGTAIEIMTGAAVPEGADAVVMVEHVEHTGNTIRIAQDRTLRAGENIVSRGDEARAGDALFCSGTILQASHIALAAACGRGRLTVFCKPAVAIVATGDELVDLADTPAPHQIRNSNSYALAALVTGAGGEPLRQSIAPDRKQELESIILNGRRADLLVLTGGVSVGTYDLVEEVLLSLGAEFFFTGVRMQPGKPVVFGRLPASGDLPAQFFFGLPGNPISTQVTFHCFVEPMIRTLSGAGLHLPRFVQATLDEDVPGKPDLTRILPAYLTSDRIRPRVKRTDWHGSGDLAANARANCYVVLPPDRPNFAAGDVVTVLLR
jgi:molybdopterin molybdotransferase